MTEQNYVLIDKILTLFKKEKSRESEASYYYRTRLNRISSWESLSGLLNKKSETDLNTSEIIKFREVPFGSSISQLKKFLGKPKFEMKNNPLIKGHLVLFYKFHIDGISTKCEVHFIDNYFFMATYTFESISDGSNPVVESALFMKYLGLKSQYFINKLRLSDSNGNILLIDRSVELNISYLSGNSYHSKWD